MSGGGGNTTTVQRSDPPSYLIPYLQDIASRGFENSQTPPAFFPGPTFLGPTQGQLDAYAQQFDYADRVYGNNAQAPSFDAASGALNRSLAGTTGLGGLGSGIGQIALPGLQQSFAGGPSQFSPSSFSPNVNYDPAAATSRLAGAAPTSAAFSRALSGQPDYAGLQSSIDAANAPILRQFNEELLPQLSQRAAFLGNPTGGIKTLNRVLPQLGQQLGENALRATEAERQRALGEQTQTAQYLTGAGLQSAGTLGGLGLQGYGLGLQGASQSAGLQDSYRQQLLGLGGLGGQLLGQTADNQLRGASLFPALAQAGQLPGQLSGQFADFGRQFQDQALQDQIARFNYYQNLPNQTLNQYSALLNGYAGLGGTQTASGPGPSRAGGAVGGAVTGATLGAPLGPFGVAGGAVLGGLAGLFL